MGQYSQKFACCVLPISVFTGLILNKATATMSRRKNQLLVIHRDKRRICCVRQHSVSKFLRDLRVKMCPCRLKSLFRPVLCFTRYCFSTIFYNPKPRRCTCRVRLPYTKIHMLYVIFFQNLDDVI